MSASPPGRPLPSAEDGVRIQVHPGTGLVDRDGDTLLVVPVLRTAEHERVKDVFAVCHRSDPTGHARIHSLRALLQAHSPAELPEFALLLRSGPSLRVLVHGPVPVLVDGHEPGGFAPGGDGTLVEHDLDDGTWLEVTVGRTPEAHELLPLDLRSGTVPGAGVTLHRVPAGRARPEPTAAVPSRSPTSATALRPAVRFRTVPLGECAARAAGGRPVPGRRRPPLPVAGAPGGGASSPGTAEPEVLVEGVICPQGHFTDPDLPTCRTCGTALPPDGHRLRLPRPPLGLLVTDGGTIYAVTGDYVIGRETERAPEVVEGRARPLPLRDGARSTSRVHARLTVTGWKVLLSDNSSANGTFLSRSGAAGPWLPVTPHAPVALVHGDRVRLGQRQLLYDTWRETAVPRGHR
jgi:hypothetical protein